LIATIKHQFKDLAAELGRVDWPGKDRVKSATLAVIVVSVFMGTFLYLADLGINQFMTFVMPHH